MGQMLSDGSGSGPDLDSHATGSPTPGGVVSATVGHTWLIVIVAVLLLWLFGGAIFRKIRM